MTQNPDYTLPTPGQPAPGADENREKRILLTGFRPFAGRAVNASWVAAHRLASIPMPGLNLRAEEIPVVWGSPHKLLTRLLPQWQPDLIISMGEGEPGSFRLETRASPRPAARPDELGALPPPLDSLEPAAPILHSSANCHGIRQQLVEQGFPVELSADAGGYLCEQLLHELESLRPRQERSYTAVFAHLPPWHSELKSGGSQRRCDETLLDEFALALLQATLEHHAAPQARQEADPE